ncbi:hypothetical protein TWF281_009662 [Arthrobotrys megalospora]
MTIPGISNPCQLVSGNFQRIEKLLALFTINTSIRATTQWVLLREDGFNLVPEIRFSISTYGVSASSMWKAERKILPQSIAFWSTFSYLAESLLKIGHDIFKFSLIEWRNWWKGTLASIILLSVTPVMKGRGAARNHAKYLLEQEMGFALDEQWKCKNLNDLEVLWALTAVDTFEVKMQLSFPDGSSGGMGLFTTGPNDF